METIGEILENIRFLTRYAPDMLLWIIIPVVFVSFLCIPLLIKYVKTIIFMLKFKKWQSVDGHIIRVSGESSGKGADIEYSFIINDTTYKASMRKRKRKGFYSSMYEGSDVKVRVDPSDYNNSEISPELSSFIFSLIPLAFNLALGYFFLYMFSSAFVVEYRSNHNMNIPLEKTEYNE
jgi:hypothetical protein